MGDLILSLTKSAVTITAS